MKTLVSALLMLIATLTALRADAKDTASDPMTIATTPTEKPDEWWQSRHAEKLAEKAAAAEAGEQIQLVWVGDSITHGWEGHGKQLWAERFAPHGALNLGYGGDRTEHVLWRLGLGDAGEENNEIGGLSPKVFVVMIGTNNTGHRQDPPEATAAGIEKIVDRLLEVSPESKVLLLAVFPRGATADDPLRVINDGINETISKLGERDSVEYLDIADVFLDDNGDLPKSVMPDRLHPEAAGYMLWANAIESQLDRLMGE